MVVLEEGEEIGEISLGYQEVFLHLVHLLGIVEFLFPRDFI